MKTVIFIIVVIAIFICYYVDFCKHDTTVRCYDEKGLADFIHTKIKYSMEYAYFEGQRDAIRGDVRIVKVDSTCYIWTKSPWDNDTSILYIPDKDTVLPNYCTQFKGDVYEKK